MHTYKRLVHMQGYMKKRNELQEMYPESTHIGRSSEPHPDYGTRDDPEVLASLRSEGEAIRANLVNCVTVIPYAGTETTITERTISHTPSVTDQEFTNRPA